MDILSSISTENGAMPRILIVEDEMLVSMMLEDALPEFGFAVAGVASRLGEAMDYVRTGAFDAALLDVQLDGHPVFPVADVLIEKGIPFLFATGYGGSGLPETYRSHPALQKPFIIDDLATALRHLFKR